MSLGHRTPVAGARPATSRRRRRRRRPPRLTIYRQLRSNNIGRWHLPRPDNAPTDRARARGRRACRDPALPSWPPRLAPPRPPARPPARRGC